MTKEIKEPICQGDSEIVVRLLSPDGKRSKYLSVWLCQGMKDADGMHETMYHVSTFGGELDELIDKLIKIRDNQDKILKKFNKV